MGGLCRRKKTMRIGIYGGHGLSDAQSGGGFTFEESILASLKKNSTDHEFFVFYHGNNEKLKDEGSVRFISLSKYYAAQKESFIGRGVKKISRFFEERRVKKHHKNLFNKALFEHNIDLVWFLTPRYIEVDLPYLFTVWDLQHRRQSFFPEVSVTGSTYQDREKFYAHVIPRAAYVIVSNQAAKQEVIRFYGLPDERVKTLTLPTPKWVLQDGGVHSELETFTIKHDYLFYPAQFWPHKNHIVILRALKALKENHGLVFDVVFTGADKGNENYVQQQVNDLGLQDSVHFLGFVSREKLRALYQNAFALVFASYFGPDNIPPLEAGALGCPIIAADVAGSKEQLGNAALFFDPKNSQELMSKILELKTSQDVRNELCKQGKQRAFAWTSKDYVQGVINIIDEFEPIRRCWSNQKRFLHS